MESLPSSVLIDLIEFLTVKEIFINIIPTCSHFKSIIESSEYLLGKLVRETLGFRRDLRLSYGKVENILRSVFSSESAPIDFKGFATSGGFDEDHPRYWVSNLFVNDGTGYCSRDNKNNINAAGVLSLTQEQGIDPTVHDYLVNIFNKSKIISMSIYPYYNGNNKLNKFQIKEFIEIYHNHTQQLIEIIAKEMGQTVEQISADLKENISKIKIQNIVGSALRRRPDDLFVNVENIDYASAASTSKFAVINKVELSRQGGFTCPVETFMVFASENYVDIEDEEFSRYDNILTPEILKEKFPGATREIVTDEESGTCYSEFYWKPANLIPIIWGKFTTRLGNAIEVNLHHRFAGVYLYAKLINPDNRMAEMHDLHETTNIDCNYLLAYGHIVDLA